MPLTCLWVDEFWQPGPSSTLPHYLPGSVPINAKDEQFTFSWDWTTTVNVIPKHPQGIVIDGKRSHPMVLSLLN